jgi:DNA-binding transcriptional MerR regulator
MTTATDRPLRIGEVAELAGTTPRTIRYYEEIGLLPGSGDRAQGKHRCYSARDVEQLRMLLRFKELLGLSLEQLTTLLAAESARAELRREWDEAADAGEQCRILDQALRHIGTQLELVRGRRRELEQFERELDERRAELRERRERLAR